MVNFLHYKHLKVSTIPLAKRNRQERQAATNAPRTTVTIMLLAQELRTSTFTVILLAQKLRTIINVMLLAQELISTITIMLLAQELA